MRKIKSVETVYSTSPELFDIQLGSTVQGMQEASLEVEIQYGYNSINGGYMQCPSFSALVIGREP